MNRSSGTLIFTHWLPVVSMCCDMCSCHQIDWIGNERRWIPVANPAYVVTLDFGEEIGIKKSSAQITALYQPEDLIGRQLVCCVNLTPMHIGSVKSEVRILGTDSEQGVVLLQPTEKVKNGDRIFWNCWSTMCIVYTTRTIIAPYQEASDSKIIQLKTDTDFDGYFEWAAMKKNCCEMHPEVAYTLAFLCATAGCRPVGQDWGKVILKSAKSDESTQISDFIFRWYFKHFAVGQNYSTIFCRLS